MCLLTCRFSRHSLLVVCYCCRRRLRLVVNSKIFIIRTPLIVLRFASGWGHQPTNQPTPTNQLTWTLNHLKPLHLRSLNSPSWENWIVTTRSLTKWDLYCSAKLQKVEDGNAGDAKKWGARETRQLFFFIPILLCSRARPYVTHYMMSQRKWVGELKDRFNLCRPFYYESRTIHRLPTDYAAEYRMRRHFPYHFRVAPLYNPED